MIRFLKGKISEIGEGYVVVEVNGFGLEIMSDEMTLSTLKEGQEVFLHTVLIFGEEPKIYGFSNSEKRALFLKLLQVSKLGPKTALKMLSSVDAGTLVSLIISGDVESLSKIPGVGRRTAERIVAELKDSLKEFEAAEKDVFEAIEALKALGYSASEASSAVREVVREGMDVSQIIKEALNVLMRRK